MNFPFLTANFPFIVAPVVAPIFAILSAADASVSSLMWVYIFDVIRMLLCPIRYLATLIGTPAASKSVQYVCRRSYISIFTSAAALNLCHAYSMPEYVYPSPLGGTIIRLSISPGIDNESHRAGGMGTFRAPASVFVSAISPLFFVRGVP